MTHAFKTGDRVQTTAAFCGYGFEAAPGMAGTVVEVYDISLGTLSFPYQVMLDCEGPSVESWPMNAAEIDALPA